MNEEIIYIISLLISITVLLIIIAYLYIQNICIKIEYFNIKLKKLPIDFIGLKIAHISDVHIPNNQFNIEKLIKILKKERPDVIVLAGDLIYKRKSIDKIQLEKLCKELSDIAKTYAVTGNHEIWNNDLEQWYKILKSNNVTVLDNRIEVFKNMQTSIVIVGLKESCRYSVENFNYENIKEDIPIILIAHRPEYFDAYFSSPISIRPDLVLSGHAHGGQFRIPILNVAIYSPNQGIFPKYSSGLYTSENGVQMVVSRGLSNSSFPIRINNRIHLPIINIK